MQNQLVKRGAAGGMLQRNTHVVACDEGERTACARKWRIPVVDPSWIIESIIKVASFVLIRSCYRICSELNE